MLNWILLIGSAGLFIFSDSLASYWARNRGEVWATVSFVVMSVLSPTAYILFGLLSARKGLPATSGLINVAVLFGTVASGVVFFRDAVSVRQVLGLIIAVIAIVLLSGGGK